MSWYAMPLNELIWEIIENKYKETPYKKMDIDIECVWLSLHTLRHFCKIYLPIYDVEVIPPLNINMHLLYDSNDKRLRIM